MRQRIPEILLKIEAIKKQLQTELWRRERYCTGKTARIRIGAAREAVRKAEEIEQWVRGRITNDEWKGLLE